MFFDNMEYMNRQGQTVFLDVPVEVLFRRLRVATQQRPICKERRMKNFASLLSVRWTVDALSMGRPVIVSTAVVWRTVIR